MGKNRMGGVRGCPSYNSWRAMNDRCLSPGSDHYPIYGGRGIKICDRWRGKDGFKHFLEDMGERPKGCSLDRIDVNGNYCPENCRWATQSEQMNNTRRNKKFTIFGKTGTFTQLFRVFGADGLKKKTAEARFYDHGWGIEDSITIPTGGKR